ncbi:MAG TPA: GNAT family protein [Thermoplasmata archaeon]|nr:GNAT family protein [Thermoplasmata archaeon]
MADLEGPAVRLRALVPADYPTIFAWANDPEVVAPYDRFAVDTIDSFVRAVETAPADPSSLAPRYVIQRRESPEPIGFVGHYVAHPVLEYIDVWYVIGDRGARGKGYGREAVGLLVGHLFATTPVDRVGATCDVENAASARLVEGLGFRREGALKGALFHHGRWHDVLVYGITRSEWAARPAPA